MITDSNQARLAKMTGRRVQERIEESKTITLFFTDNEWVGYFDVNP
jgi:hypothetical protein